MRSCWLVMLMIALLVGIAVDGSAVEPRVVTLIPGITVTRLPVTLTNIDSVEYGPDGRLYAAGYDGRIHVLADTDGDGVEDQSDVYWEKAGDLLTPVGILPTKEGVYVAARGKIALLKDTDGDGRADTSEAVVSGWVKETNNSDTRNDAAGLAIDGEGNLYFSLGCMSYNKAWLLDDDGKSHYDKTSERGTILKVSPDRKHREVLATGLRFVVGLDFNRHGDLFATDQEGDTWFPGGNPRDELLHIIPGRHYGFPFRHPQYLPDSVDEPFVVGFSPQHQSACGFRFNETRPNRRRFGPKHWDGNAIVSGFSRGKLWRVPLAKTRAGYVGKQVQIAAFESLLTDVAISPTGDLLVTSHSGHPDWGAGPAANGLLYKITFDRQAPQPVIAWPAGPLEVKVAFDRPIDPQQLEAAEIEMGQFVWEGDRHEWIYPGYEVVKAAKQSVRRPLKVSKSSLSDDGRTVTFTTAPQPWRARYGITLPGVAVSDAGRDAEGSTVELSYDLGGVDATWTRKGDTKPTWTGWLPHVDTNVIRTMTAGSVEHERLLSLMKEPGLLTMRSLLLLPGREVALRFESNAPFHVKCGDADVSSRADNSDREKQSAQFTLTAKGPRTEDDPRGGREQVLPTEEVRLDIEIRTGGTGGDVSFDASYHADFDPHERPLRLEHLFVPWASSHRPPQHDSEKGWSGEVVAGDPEKGRAIFFGKEANCAACHMFGGKGGKVAADLSVSVHRSPEAVLRDIVKPSASINPDYVSYTILTDKGQTLTGLFLSADDQHITLVDATPKTHTINRDDIEDLRASSVSLMPNGFDKLGKEKLQDLVAFLCTENAEARKQGLSTGVILREHWLNVPGDSIASLTGHPDFPEKPSETGLLTRFEGPVNGPQHYGARIRGYIHPPQTGDYTFWVAADDHAELWLSTSETPADKVRIVTLNRWTRSRDWDAYPEQKSKPIHLEAGRRYYIEALHTEATVDDCLAVGWQLPDGTKERPIPGKRLSTGMDKPKKLSGVSPNSLRAVSYNVQFLPGLARYKNKRGMPTYRAEQIAEKMAAFDVVGLNETFDDEPREIIHSRIKEQWGADCHILWGPQPDTGRFNGGLSLISRFPFVETHSMIYENFSSPAKYGLRADGFAAKGVLHARLVLSEARFAGQKRLDVFVTHLEARDGSLRRMQFDELAVFLSRHTSQDREFLLLGDLNTRGNAEYRSAPHSTYNQLFGVLNNALPGHHVIDTWPSRHPHQDGGTKYQAEEAGGPRIDYIIIGQPQHASKRSAAAALRAAEVRVNPYLDDNVEALSDHSAVEAILTWSFTDPHQPQGNAERH